MSRLSTENLDVVDTIAIGSLAMVGSDDIWQLIRV